MNIKWPTLIRIFLCGSRQQRGRSQPQPQQRQQQQTSRFVYGWIWFRALFNIKRYLCLTCCAHSLYRSMKDSKSNLYAIFFLCLALFSVVRAMHRWCCVQLAVVHIACTLREWKPLLFMLKLLSLVVSQCVFFVSARSFVRSSSGHSMRCIAHEKPTHAFDYPLNSHIEPVLLEMKILFSDWLIRHFKNKNWPVYHSLIDTVTRYNVKRQGEELIAAPEYWS